MECIFVICHPLLPRYGEQGRSWYSVLNAVDFLFAACYTMFLGCVLRSPATLRWAGAYDMDFLILLPMLCFVCDIGENICVRMILSSYPRIQQEVPLSLRCGAA